MRIAQKKILSTKRLTESFVYLVTARFAATMDEEFTFPSPFDKKIPQKRKTAPQFRIMSASQVIRYRIGWREQLTNDEMIGNWMAEAIGNGLKPFEFAAVLDHLKHCDKLANGSVEVGAVDGTRQADIPEQLKNEFVATANNFLSKSTSKDYDGGTDDMVVNDIDPRLYASVSGVTRLTDFDLDLTNCLRYVGVGEPKDEFIMRGHRNRVSSPFLITVYQLLPAEFRVNETGQVKINSYINNLHPKNEANLYSLIERVFACFVPLFDGVLHDLLSAGSTEAMNLNSFKRRKLDTQPYLHGRDIQVIVRMKSTELTPEKPEFNGGDWHIEGEENDHIIASGIYCFQTENITESRVYFRQLRGKNQEMGSIATPENRLLAFPNICQHRSGPFQLLDTTRPGFRKILVFF